MDIPKLDSDERKVYLGGAAKKMKLEPLPEDAFAGVPEGLS